MVVSFVCFVIFLQLIFVTARYPCNQELRKHKNFHLIDQSSNCGKGSIRQSKIMNGEKVGLGEFPWVAYINIKDVLSDTVIDCTGALVSERYVVSAAHCFAPDPVKVMPENMKVLLDLRNVREFEAGCGELCGYQEYDVEEVVSHQLFNSTTFHNDISLVRLAQAVPLNNYMRPVCLPVACDVVNMELKDGHPVTAAGWGDLSEVPRRKSSVLMKTKMSVIPCGPVKVNKILVPAVDSKVCATGVSRKGSPTVTCAGDSGGPLMVDFQGKMFLLGVVSTASVCDEKRLRKQGSRADFTRVPSFLPWILDNIRP